MQGEVFDMKKLIAFLLPVLIGGTAAATAVLSTHDAGAALKAARAGGATTNPYTDADGGVWTFGHADAGMDTTSFKKMDKTTKDNWGYGFIGFNEEVTGTLPVVFVNSTDKPYGGEIITEESLFIPEGELVAHPAQGESLSSAVIRFSPQTAGLYRVDFLAQYLGTGNGVTVSLVTNKTHSCYAKTLLSASSSATHWNYLHLAAGDTVDFVLGNNGDHQSDATHLKIVLTRIDSLSGTSSSAGETLIKARSQSTPKNPCDDGALGYWSYGDAAVTSDGADTSDFTLMSRSDKDWGADFFGFNAYYSGSTLPCVFVNKSSEPSGGTQTTESDLFAAPGELYVHPGATRSAVVRFSPVVSGLYRVSGCVQHIAKGEMANGVIAYIVQDGTRELMRTTLMHTNAKQNDPFVVTSYAQLEAGGTVDFVVDPNGTNNHSSDTTKMTASVTLIDPIADGGVSAGAALKAARFGVTPVNPVYETSLRGSWRFLAADGTNLSYAAKLLTATNKEWWSDGTVYGLNLTDSSGAAAHPTIQVNASDKISTDGNGAIGTGRAGLAPEEIIVHPADPGSSAYPCPAIHYDSAVAGLHNVFCSVRVLSADTTDGLSRAGTCHAPGLFT